MTHTKERNRIRATHSNDEMIHYYFFGKGMFSRYIVCQILHEKAISVDSEPSISESVMSTASGGCALGGWRGGVAKK